jgi:hypothetical protein
MAGGDVGGAWSWGGAMMSNVSVQGKLRHAEFAAVAPLQPSTYRRATHVQSRLPDLPCFTHHSDFVHCFLANSAGGILSRMSFIPTFARS